MDERFNPAGYDLKVIEDRPPVDDAILGGPKQEEQIETSAEVPSQTLAEYFYPDATIETPLGGH